MSEAEQKATVKANTDVVFKWSSYHNVFQFPDKTAYDNCDFSKATELATNDQNPYTYKAKSPGNFYFGCAIGAGGHCRTPQKLPLTITGMFSVWANFFLVSCGYLVV